MQIRLAQVLEYNTGPAKKPDDGGAGGGGAAGAKDDDEEEEVDPLDAFMVGVQAEVKADKGKALSKQQVRRYSLRACVRACRERALRVDLQMSSSRRKRGCASTHTPEARLSASCSSSTRLCSGDRKWAALCLEPNPCVLCDTALHAVDNAERGEGVCE